MTWCFYIFLLLLIVGVTSDCPSQELTKPCRCYNDALTCTGSGDWFDFKAVMKRISDSRQNKPKHFKSLEISHTRITELEANATVDLTFDKIVISAYYLKKIHQDAFKGTANRVKEFRAEDFDNLNLPPPYNTFDLLSSLVNVEKIRLRPAKASQIPSTALKPLRKLLDLSIGHGRRAVSGNWITVGDDPFIDCDNLKVVGLDDNKINWISARAFNFRNNLNRRMNIYLFRTNLNESNFLSGWLNNINRLANVHINDNNIKYLEERIFKPFLDDTRNNEVSNLNANPLNCSDCRNAWLARESGRYKNRMKEAYCNGRKYSKTVFDSNFDHCPHV